MYARTKMLKKHNILTISSLRANWGGYSVGYALANSV